MIRKIILFIIFVPIILLGISAYLFQDYITETPLELNSPSYVLLVTPGMPVQKIADQMARDGLLKYPKLFLLWVTISDVRTSLKAGEYLIKEGSTLQDVINLLISGKVIQHPFTIVEGWNFETMMQAIQQAPELKQTLVGLTAKEIMAKLGQPDKHPEGRFYPDTYYFPLGTTDLAFLQRAYNTMEAKLKNAWEKRSHALHLESPYQALILASIIEKESCDFSEYEEISGVFHRRLQRGMPLQADPTVIYGAGKAYNGVITGTLLKASTPYNTYTNTGLPPTPIAMPSERAILAALQPKKGETLYFVAKGNCKGHVFSKTLEAHQAAVNHYRRIVQSQSQSQSQSLSQNLNQSKNQNQSQAQSHIQAQSQTQSTVLENRQQSSLHSEVAAINQQADSPPQHSGSINPEALQLLPANALQLQLGPQHPVLFFY